MIAVHAAAGLTSSSCSTSLQTNKCHCFLIKEIDEDLNALLYKMKTAMQYHRTWDEDINARWRPQCITIQDEDSNPILHKTWNKDINAILHEVKTSMQYYIRWRHQCNTTCDEDLNPILCEMKAAMKCYMRWRPQCNTARDEPIDTILYKMIYFIKFRQHANTLQYPQLTIKKTQIPQLENKISSRASS